MSAQGSLIAPFTVGLDNDTEPWQSPADSFSEANNVHIFNGYVEKRSGYRKFAHLKNHDALRAISGITQAANGVVTTVLPHGLVNDDVVLIKNVLGMTQVNDRYYYITVTAPDKFELNVSTVAYGLYTGAGDVYKSIDFNDRVMGIAQFLKADGSRDTLAFSTLRAHKYDPVSDSFLMMDSVDIMGCTDTDYVWSINLQSASLQNRLYFTNGREFNVTVDGIRYYDGSGTGYTTTQFTPDLGGGKTLYGAKLLFCLKERLVVLNTYERLGATTTNCMQRARWCQAQGPSNWNDLTPGGGGYVDAPTGDQIITARALQDQLIVFFTNSVWAFQPVSDPALPFKWVKLNDFRAADGKMASIGYDQHVTALGLRGITASNGSETQRIDARIRDFISDEININEFDKVFAARSYSERRTWILYPEIEQDENTAALIFDEESNAYTTYSISLNCLGYGSFSSDYMLSDFTAQNDLDITIGECDQETLISYLWQDKEEVLLGGDIVGNVYVLETEGSDNNTAISSTLTTAGWNPFLTQGSEAVLSYLDIYVDTSENTIAKVDFFKDDETAPYASQTIDFLPNLDYLSTIEAISQANPGVVTASDHGLTSGDIVYIYGVDGMDEINSGPYTCTVINGNEFSVGVDTSAYGAFSGSGSVYRREFYKTKTWKRAFAGGTGYIHKVRITSSGIDRPFRISGFKPVFKPRGRRIVN